MWYDIHVLVFAEDTYMESYKSEFIEFMVDCNVLKFGDFVTKSGRQTPFFVNTGFYRTGSQLKKLGEYYAKAIYAKFGTDFDVLFGPVYKGIPLTVATCIAFSEMYGKDIRYLTVHMSKGLECENVILINMSDEYLGFPSKIKDNNWFMDNNEMEYAEERRLFYVALTRCKERIYILVPRGNPSMFIEEIKVNCVELLMK